MTSNIIVQYSRGLWADSHRPESYCFENVLRIWRAKLRHHSPTQKHNFNLNITLKQLDTIKNNSEITQAQL